MNPKLVLLGIIFAVTVRLFSFILIDDFYFDLLEMAIVVTIILYNLSSSVPIITPFNFYIKSIIALTLLSSIAAFFFHGQSFELSLLASRTIFFWLLYFSLHKMKLRPKKLEDLLLIFGSVWSIIMIIQQLTYPNILFNVYHGVTYENGEDRIVEVRGGLTRIMIAGIGFSYFMVCFMWQKLHEKLSFRNIMLFSLVVAGILLTQSRQIIFGIILIFTVDTVLSFRASSLKSIRFTTLFFGIAILFFAIAGDFIFALIELSQEQKVTSDTYIRGLEIDFFLFKYWPNPLCYLIGNGWDHAHSAYGLEMKEHIQRSMGYHRSDIGLIGAFNKFGIIYVAVIIMFYIKVLIPQKHFIIPKYIRIFFILCAITSLSGSNFFELSSFFVPFTCLFYIVDKTNEEHLYRYSNSQQVIVDEERYQVAA